MEASKFEHTAITLTVSDLSKRYHRDWIFRRLSREFQSGSTYAIIGPNGSGKSTLLQVLWGQVPPTGGTLRFRVSDREIPTEEVFQHLAIATPYMDLIEEFTLAEMLDFHFKLKKLRRDLDFETLLSRMYLSEAADKPLMNFSSGMKQRLKLALALYSEAGIYFLDEPGTNLDARAFEWYREELRQLPAGAMVFVASNNPAEYPASATSINIMDFKR